MSRYIKATEAADIISNKFNIPLSELVDIFAEIPIADVEEVRHGKWVVSHEYGNNYYNCSLCGFKDVTKTLYEDYFNTANYCPNCGAKMDGGNEQDD